MIPESGGLFWRRPRDSRCISFLAVTARSRPRMTLSAPCPPRCRRCLEVAEVFGAETSPGPSHTFPAMSTSPKPVRREGADRRHFGKPSWARSRCGNTPCQVLSMAARGVRSSPMNIGRPRAPPRDASSPFRPGQPLAPSAHRPRHHPTTRVPRDVFPSSERTTQAPRVAANPRPGSAPLVAVARTPGPTLRLRLGAISRCRGEARELLLVTSQRSIQKAPTVTRCGGPSKAVRATCPW